jgi:hypothetical protein
MAKVIGCDIHWRNDVVSAALPVPLMDNLKIIVL